jgi:hypothetical protein
VHGGGYRNVVPASSSTTHLDKEARRGFVQLTCFLPFNLSCRRLDRFVLWLRQTKRVDALVIQSGLKPFVTQRRFAAGPLRKKGSETRIERRGVGLTQVQGLLNLSNIRLQDST